MILSISALFLAINTVSSANARTGINFLEFLSAYPFFSFKSFDKRGFINRIKSKGDKGSPCQTPDLIEKNLETPSELPITALVL